MKLGDLVALLSVLIAAASFAFAIQAARSSRRAHDSTEALRRRGNELAERQTEVGQRAWADAFFRDVTAWATGASLAISQGIHLGSDEGELADILSRLSVSIDTGRWYFPNSPGEGEEEAKQPAYRGKRQAILDHLVDAYAALANDSGESRRERLRQCQRAFVSEVQLILDPRARDAVLANVISEFRDAERARG